MADPHRAGVRWSHRLGRLGLFGNREWPYSDEPLWGRLFYFALFALMIGGVAIWLILRGAAASN